ncbi:MAG: triose-phosphate isomerase, partial [Candidatus Omnitrophica bacterium]|nr:triose-phosphate isomerase [Candidatus Omnitrophota bacterium]
EESGSDVNARTPEQEIAQAISIGLKEIPANKLLTFPITIEPTALISTQGTGTSINLAKAGPEDAQKRTDAVRAALETYYGKEVAKAANVGYGASVTADNAKGIFATNTNNALIGGASYTPSLSDLVKNGMKGVVERTSSILDDKNTERIKFSDAAQLNLDKFWQMFAERMNDSRLNPNLVDGEKKSPYLVKRNFISGRKVFLHRQDDELVISVWDKNENVDKDAQDQIVQMFNETDFSTSTRIKTSGKEWKILDFADQLTAKTKGSDLRLIAPVSKERSKAEKELNQPLKTGEELKFSFNHGEYRYIVDILAMPDSEISLTAKRQGDNIKSFYYRTTEDSIYDLWLEGQAMETLKEMGVVSSNTPREVPYSLVGVRVHYFSDKLDKAPIRIHETSKFTERDAAKRTKQLKAVSKYDSFEQGDILTLNVFTLAQTATTSFEITFAKDKTVITLARGSVNEEALRIIENVIQESASSGMTFNLPNEKEVRLNVQNLVGRLRKALVGPLDAVSEVKVDEKSYRGGKDLFNKLQGLDLLSGHTLTVYFSYLGKKSGDYAEIERFESTVRITAMGVMAKSDFLDSKEERSFPKENKKKKKTVFSVIKKMACRRILRLVRFLRR